MICFTMSVMNDQGQFEEVKNSTLLKNQPFLVVNNQL